MKAAREWLLGLVAMSEPLRPRRRRGPELVPVVYDEAAIRECLREMGLISTASRTSDASDERA